MRLEAKVVIMCVMVLLALVASNLAGQRHAVPLEVIDPSAKTYSIWIQDHHPYYHVKDPVLGIRGQLTFQNNGKEIVLGPAVKWVATEE